MARVNGFVKRWKKYLSPHRGLDVIKEELAHLKGIERQAVINAIAVAREHGDLSENAEYHAAREKQSFIEGRISELEDVTLSLIHI